MCFLSGYNENVAYLFGFNESGIKQPYLNTSYHLDCSQVIFYNCITSIVREIIYTSIFTLEQIPVKSVDLDRITQIQVRKVAFLFKFRYEDLGI